MATLINRASILNQSSVECVVLAGGLGTRLQGVIGAMPKCMAPVAGRPFLFYLFEYLAAQGCKRVVLSLGFKHELVQEWIEKVDFGFEVHCVVEEQALGTGGALAFALQHCHNDQVLVINGDTLFRVDTAAMMGLHQDRGAALTLALKPMQHFDRYGTVGIDDAGLVHTFEEKKFQEQGLINGGVYIIDRKAFLSMSWPKTFSLEQDYLERYVHQQKFWAYCSEAYFIDIGVPKDYEQVQIDCATDQPH